MSSRGNAAVDRAPRTAIGRAHGRHRTFLIATCAALVLAAVGVPAMP